MVSLSINSHEGCSHKHYLFMNDYYNNQGFESDSSGYSTSSDDDDDANEEINPTTPLLPMSGYRNLAYDDANEEINPTTPLLPMSGYRNLAYEDDDEYKQM